MSPPNVGSCNTHATVPGLSPPLCWVDGLCNNRIHRRTRQLRTRNAKVRDREVMRKLRDEVTDLKTIVTTFAETNGVDADANHEVVEAQVIPTSITNCSLWPAYKAVEEELEDCKQQIAEMYSADQVKQIVERKMSSMEESGAQTEGSGFFSHEQVMEIGQCVRDQVYAEHADEVAYLKDNLHELKDMFGSMVSLAEHHRVLANNAALTQQIEILQANGISSSSHDSVPVPTSPPTREHLLKSQIKRLVAEKETFRLELKVLKEQFDEKVAINSRSYFDALLNVVHLPSSDHGVVFGVTSQPSLNGTVVFMKQWHHNKQRWEVQTADGKSFLLKADNVLKRSSCLDTNSSNDSDPEHVEMHPT